MPFSLWPKIRDELISSHPDTTRLAQEGSRLPPGEVDLFGFFVGVIQYWRHLAVATAIGLALGLVLSGVMTKKYTTQVVMSPNKSRDLIGSDAGALGLLGGIAGLDLGDNADSVVAIETLKSGHFIQSFLKAHDATPVLFPEEKSLIERIKASVGFSQQTSAWHAYRYFVEDVMEVSEDRTNGLVYLNVTWTSPEISALWASQLISDLNFFMRDKEIKRLQAQFDFLMDKLGSVREQAVRDAIMKVLEGHINRSMLVSSEPQFAFEVVSPAIELPADEYTWPNSLLFAFLGGTLGLTLAFLAASVVSVRRKN